MYSFEHPWIKEREATLCTWKFDYDRGYISNMSVSLGNDKGMRLYRYSGHGYMLGVALRRI